MLEDGWLQKLSVARIEQSVFNMFTRSLRLCPLEARLDFGAEMKSVFGKALSISRGCGATAMLLSLRRAVKHLPGSLLREYRDAGWERKVDMGWITTGLSGRWEKPMRRVPTGWGEASLAAVPYILFLILEVLPKLLGLVGMLARDGVGMRVVNVALIVLSGSFLLLALGFSVRRGWPLWSASWYVLFWVSVLLPLGSDCHPVIIKQGADVVGMAVFHGRLPSCGTPGS